MSSCSDPFHTFKKLLCVTIKFSSWAVTQRKVCDMPKYNLVTVLYTYQSWKSLVRTSVLGEWPGFLMQAKTSLQALRHLHSPCTTASRQRATAALSGLEASRLPLPWTEKFPQAKTSDSPTRHVWTPCKREGHACLLHQQNQPYFARLPLSHRIGTIRKLAKHS